MATKKRSAQKPSAETGANADSPAPGAGALTEATFSLGVLRARKRQRAKASLSEFVRQHWETLEPTTPLVWNWHMDAVCQHLEAVSRGQLKRLVVNIPPGHCKPCHVDGMVLERERGRIRLGDVKAGDFVLTHAGRFRRVTAVHEQGMLSVLRITTHTGRELVLAPDHPVLTPRGWIQAGHLTTADVLAEVHATERCGGNTVSPEEARLLGYLIGDGCVKYSGKIFTNQDQQTVEDFRMCAAAIGLSTSIRTRSGKTAPVFVVTLTSGAAPKHRARGEVGDVRAWLRRHGLDGKDSYTKRVPAEIMAATPELIAEYIGAYWACDGFVAKRDGRATECCIGSVTVSEGLARDTQHLLNRLGIQARVRKKVARIKSVRQGDTYTSWQVNCTSVAYGSKFAALIPIRHSKAKQLDRYLRTGFDRVLNEDRVVSVEPAGESECRCLTVEEDSSFAFNDIAVHNSLLVSVFWPAWHWAAINPGWRVLASSYAHNLAVRDSVRCRALIESPEYVAEYSGPGKWRMRDDQNLKHYFENTVGGIRQSTSVGGQITGYRGDAVVVDDPINATEATSELARQRVIDWWDQAMSSRLSNPREGSRVIIMQRLHENDLTGHVLSQGGYEHLCLPSEFESKRRATTSIGWSDPRKEDGEELFPAMFPTEVLDRAKVELGSYGYSGQHQQRPANADGGLFRRQWFKRWDVLPPLQDEWMAVVDCSFKDAATSDFVVVQVWCRLKAQRYLVQSYRARLSFSGTCALIRRVVAEWPKVHCVLVEDKANGPAVIDALKGEVPGVIGFNPGSNSKEERAASVSPLVEAGQVFLPADASGWEGPAGDKLEAFLHEACVFPRGANDDQVDCLSMALLRWRQPTANAKVMPIASRAKSTRLEI